MLSNIQIRESWWNEALNGRQFSSRIHKINFMKIMIKNRVTNEAEKFMIKHQICYEWCEVKNC